MPTFVNVRAKKQKLLLVSPNYIRLTSVVSNIIGLRYPGVYTGKGILNRKFGKPVLKKRKQQTRK